MVPGLHLLLLSILKWVVWIACETLLFFSLCIWLAACWYLLVFGSFFLLEDQGGSNNRRGVAQQFSASR